VDRQDGEGDEQQQQKKRARVGEGHEISSPADGTDVFCIFPPQL
jgi:hypothetical protein